MTNEQTANDQAIAKALQELEDQASAQTIADEQREEAFRSERRFEVQCMPLEPKAIYPPQQANKDPIYWSKYQQELQSKSQSAYSQHLPKKSHLKQPHERIEVYGKPAVTHQLINKYKNCKENCEKCRHLMQKVSLLVTETEEWCRKDCEVTCYGEHFTRVFWSGNRTNKMVVQMVGGEVRVSVTEKGWRMWFKNAVQKCWSKIKGFGLKIFDKAASIMMKGSAAAISGCILALM